MGRVTSINALATYGARPLGAVIAGIVGSRFGVDTCFYVVVAAFLVQVTMFFLSPLPRTDAHALAAHD
jgi:predicted MFS family arabinose efflux permease